MNVKLTLIPSFIVCVWVCPYISVVHIVSACEQVFLCIWWPESTFGFVPWVQYAYLFVYSLMLKPGLFTYLGLSGWLNWLARKPQGSSISTSPTQGLQTLTKMSSIKNCTIIFVFNLYELYTCTQCILIIFTRLLTSSTCGIHSAPFSFSSSFILFF